MSEEYGPLLFTAPDGTQIYRRGVLDSRGFFEVNIGIFNYSSSFNPNSGLWEEGAVSFVTQVGDRLDFELSADGDLEFSASGRVGVVELGFVISETGDVFPVLGLGIGYGDFGFGVGYVIADDRTNNFSRLDTVTVMPNGEVYKTTYSQGDDEFPYIKATTVLYAADGSIIGTYVTSIGDAQIAADLAAGLPVDLQGSECFSSETSIAMFDGSSRIIARIVPGDVVLSYDATGTLMPGRVTRTFRNEVSHLLDVHGLKVTPGHSTLCGEGTFRGRHVPIIDILLSDGALVMADGTLIRIAINAPVGSIMDAMVKVAVAFTPEDVEADKLELAEMRAGTLLFDREGLPVSVLDCLVAEGYDFDAQTGLIAKFGESPHPLFWYGRLPRPEDYILKRSRESLEDILVDGEWEGSPSELIAARLRHTLIGKMN